MNKIKFSHEYLKLSRIDTKNPVKLIKIGLIMREEQPQPFINYDTGYYDDKGRKCYYPLKPGKYILLFLMDQNGMLFTTIRPHTLDKYSYYCKQLGDFFKLEVKK